MADEIIIMALDADTGDAVIENGDVKYLRGVEAVAQLLRCRFRMYRGEWFLDAREGTPWFEEILGQDPDDTRITSALRRVILTTPYVSGLETDPVLVFDNETRDLSVAFRASTEFGVLDTRDFPPFVIDLSTTEESDN